MPGTNDISGVTDVWVNARFLDRPVTGVERVARELIDAMATEYLDADGCWHSRGRRFRLRLIAPSSGTATSPWPNLSLRRAGRLAGHAWEQLELPALTAGQWLVSLCNTGPLLKRRHCLFLHDAQPFAIPRNFSLGFRLWYRLLFNIAGRSARHILVNSRFTLRELRTRVGLAGERMTLLYPGSDHVRRADAGGDVLSGLDLPDQPFLLAVASANPNKNFAAVIDALKILGDQAPPCVIVGRASQKHFRGVELRSDRVRHLGYVSDDQLLALYRRALCLVFPSYYEGFGLPPLEAMAAGCPVIASHTSAMPEIGGRAVDYCDPDDARSVADAVGRLAGSPARRRMLIRQGRRRAASFAWRDSAATLLRVVSDSASQSHRGESPWLRKCRAGIGAG